MDEGQNAGCLLLIDDDTELRDLLRELLEAEDFRIEGVGRGDEGVKVAARGGFDLIVLDVMLPGMGGFEVLKRIRALLGPAGRVPVVMLTARGESVDRVVGLELGADDYLAKPFDPRELVARIRAILRRTASDAPGGRELLREGDIEVDTAAREARQNGLRLALTGAEFDILTSLLRSTGRPVSREELSQTALGRKYFSADRSVDTHVSSLRKKLGAAPSGRERIQNLRGVGYVWTLSGR